jgi:DNA polymerase-3 subunit beta
MAAPHFIVEQKSLHAVLTAMLPICARRTTLEVTSSILFHVRHRELILKSTDLEVALQASCPLEQSFITEPVTFLVPGKRIADIVKELEGAITCSVEQQQLSLRTNAGVVNLNLMNADQFPPFPERIENLTSIPSALMSELLKSVSFVIPSQHTNAALTGLLWEMDSAGIRMTATDGHCLAQARASSVSVETHHQWIVPRRAVIEIQKLIDTMDENMLFMGICGKQLVISGEWFNFFTKVLAGSFPQYAPILQRDAFIPASIDRHQLVKTIRRVSSLLSGQFVAAQFHFSPHTLHVAMQNKDVGTLAEDIQLLSYEGEACEMRFYAPYLLNGLSVFQEEKLTLFLKSATKPIIFESVRPTGLQLTYLVMPVAAQAQ